MSKFINEDNKNSRQQVGYDIDTDLLRGFKRAVNNNQPQLALEYLAQILDILEANFEVKDDSLHATETAPKSQMAKPAKAAVKEADATN